ncbi:MAG: WD40 repeat domain-containing protein [Planctomycetes bacterium]|jgi:hypothetical protein|nr:WD40 repeat domain-containing protein [Planctomycetota bacterium]
MRKLLITIVGILALALACHAVSVSAAAGGKGVFPLPLVGAQQGEARETGSKSTAPAHFSAPVRLDCKSEVNTVSFSPDDRLLGISTNAGDVFLYDIGAKKIRRIAKHKRGVGGISFSPNGRYVAWRRSAGRNVVYDLWQEQEIWEFAAHTRWATALAFSACSQILLTGGEDGRIASWDIIRKKKILELEAHSKSDRCPITGIDVASSNKVFASASWDNTIRICELNTGRELIKIKGYGEFASACFSRDGKMIVGAAPYDTNLRIWEVATGLERLRLPQPPGVLAIALHGSGRWLAVGDRAGNIQLVNIYSGQQTTIKALHTKLIFCVAISHDGRRIATGSWDKTVAIVDLGEFEGEPKRLEPSNEDLNEQIPNLFSKNAATAFKAIRLLTKSAKTVPLLQKTLTNVRRDVPIDANFKAVLKRLESGSYLVREKASSKLAKMELGIESRKMLEGVVQASSSPEVKNRLRVIVGKMTLPSRERLFWLRSLEILEQIGDSKAKKLLEEIAQQEDGVGEEARFSLNRLKKNY